MVEEIEPTSLSPHKRLLSLRDPGIVLRYSYGNDMDNPNVLLKMAVIPSLSCVSDQSDVKEFYPIRASPANFALEFSLGKCTPDADQKGEHTGK